MGNDAEAAKIEQRLADLSYLPVEHASDSLERGIEEALPKHAGAED